MNPNDTPEDQEIDATLETVGAEPCVINFVKRARLATGARLMDLNLLGVTMVEARNATDFGDRRRYTEQARESLKRLQLSPSMESEGEDLINGADL